MSPTTRRRRRLLGLLAAASVVAAACGSTPAPSLTDPREIVMAAVRSTDAAKSVHLDATLDGSVTADLS